MPTPPPSVSPVRQRPPSGPLAARLVSLRHLYTSPAHVYKGHHGREPGTEPVVETDRLDCVAGRGLVGDRYFDYKPDFKGQITFLDWHVYREVTAAVGADVPPSALRRNVVIEGIDLNTLVGRDFRIGRVAFRGVEECRPCYWMDRALAPGAEDLLRGKGGLRARILTSGALTPGPARLVTLDR